MSGLHTARVAPERTIYSARLAAVLFAGSSGETEMAYADKLKHPNWQRKRLEIMERDKFKCRECGATENMLNVHHLHYEYGRDPWDYHNNSLITLCESCHEEEHNYTDVCAKSLIESIRKCGGGYKALSILNICFQQYGGTQLTSDDWVFLVRLTLDALIERRHGGSVEPLAELVRKKVWADRSITVANCENALIHGAAATAASGDKSKGD